MRIERHCLQVDLDLNGSGLKYESGDHVGVWPVNDEEHVEKLAKVLRLGNAELDKVITLKPNKENKSAESAKLPFPLPCTIRTALLHYLDLPAIVKQYQLEVSVHEPAGKECQAEKSTVLYRSLPSMRKILLNVTHSLNSPTTVSSLFL